MAKRLPIPHEKRISSYIRDTIYFQATGKLSTYLIMQFRFLWMLWSKIQLLIIFFWPNCAKKNQKKLIVLLQSKMMETETKVNEILHETHESRNEHKERNYYSKRGAQRIFKFRRNFGEKVLEEAKVHQIWKRKKNGIVVKERKISCQRKIFSMGSAFMCLTFWENDKDLNYLMCLNGYPIYLLWK